MLIDSSGDIKQINCGFIFPDGSFYGTDDYRRGYWTHEGILQHYGIKETPGVIRFCSSFIMFESAKHLSMMYKIDYPEEYNVGCITKEQSKLLREWMGVHNGTIPCPATSSKQYQFRYLESLDDKMLSNIIML